MVKSLRKIVAKHYPELLIGLGLFLFSISLIHNLIRIRTLRIDEATVQSLLSQPSNAQNSPNYPIHIEIPWYVNVGISPQIYQNGSWTISPSDASYLTASSLPGQKGNIIIYGHNKREILGNLRALKGYEKIKLTMSDGTTRSYQIKSLHQVAPTQTELLSPTKEETLTLYTCSGLFDSQRFVVRATPIKDPVDAP